DQRKLQMRRFRNTRAAFELEYTAKQLLRRSGVARRGACFAHFEQCLRHVRLEYIGALQLRERGAGLPPIHQDNSKLEHRCSEPGRERPLVPELPLRPLEIT